MNRDSADLGRDNDNGEDPAGVSSLIFGQILKGGEHIPRVDVVAFVLGLHGGLVVLVFLGKHWLSETVKTIT